MHRRLSVPALLPVLALASGLAACDSGPYVYIAPTVTVGKMPDQIRKYGYLIVCYDDGEEAKADALAVETCAGYNLAAYKASNRRDQCSMTEPHEITYFCVNPKMRFANGSYVNPLNQHEVKLWEEQEARVAAIAAAHPDKAATPKPAPPAPPPPAPAAAPAPAAPPPPG